MWRRATWCYLGRYGDIRWVRDCLTAQWLAEGTACGARHRDPPCEFCRDVGRDVHCAYGSRGPGFRGAGSRDPGDRRALVVRARGRGRTAVRLVGQGLSGTATGLRRDPAAWAGSPGRRRPGAHRRGRAYSRQCPRARADCGDQDVPELLAGNRDRGRRAVAAGPDRRRGGEPPGLRPRAGVRDAALTPGWQTVFWQTPSAPERKGERLSHTIEINISERCG